MSAPNATPTHPITGNPWDCACPCLGAVACAEARYPSRRLPFEDEPEEDVEPCGCACHDQEDDDSHDW